MRFGALPQVTSNFVSYTLLRFEINVRDRPSWASSAPAASARI